MKNIEVIFEPKDYNKLSKTPWTIHYEDEKGMDRGIGEYFATSEEADKRLMEILLDKTDGMIDESLEALNTGMGIEYLKRLSIAIQLQEDDIFRKGELNETL